MSTFCCQYKIPNKSTFPIASGDPLRDPIFTYCVIDKLMARIAALGAEYDCGFYW